jgi:coenzyme F420-reducing hydrogenase delta subunit
MGHICPDAASVTTALSKGAVGVMVSGVKASVPPAIT